MLEKTSKSDGRIDDAAAEMPDARTDGHHGADSPGSSPPPPSSPLPAMNTHSKHVSGRGLEPAQESPAKSPRQRSPNLHSPPPGPPRTSIPSPRTSGILQEADGQRSLPSSSRQDKKTSQSARIASSSPASTRDLEKASPGHHSPRSAVFHQTASSHHTTTIYTTYEEEDAEDDPKQHAMWILIYLSALAPILALSICFYTLIVTVLILVLSPLCLCVTASPLTVNFRRFLAPALSLQLGLIFSDFEVDEPSFSSPSMLILVNVLAPVFSVGVMLAAWVAAGFWFTAAILGEPNKNSEKEKSDDGKATVMYVRNLWERILIRGLR